jgi:hypothetical protein
MPDLVRYRESLAFRLLNTFANRDYSLGTTRYAKQSAIKASGVNLIQPQTKISNNIGELKRLIHVQKLNQCSRRMFN